jgi:hypothetical protein
VQLLASDAEGNATLTSPGTLRVDGQPPVVTIRSARGHTISVRVRDPASGVSAHALTISFGDGQRARGSARFRHVYARAGLYQIVVNVADKVGNRSVVRRLVNVP